MARSTSCTTLWACALGLALACGCAGQQQDGPAALTADVVGRSIDLCRRNLLARQTPAGDFIYEYDFVAHLRPYGNNGVRQAGALWGLALLHQDSPQEETASAVALGLSFFRSHSRPAPGGGRLVFYPGEPGGSTGALALVALALAEMLRTELAPEARQEYEAELRQYLLGLLALRREDGRFAGGYSAADGAPAGQPSPYSDGEALLLMVKAAKYCGHAELKPEILASAAGMHELNVRRALARAPDSATTKGFYQWGSMAYYELWTTGWPGTEPYAERVIDLADWMIDIHRTLDRRRNTAYAHEGLAVAWELARLTGRPEAQEKIGGVIRRGLGKLITWQVGGPAPNAYVRAHPTGEPLAIGGVMNAADDPVLRIDVTQHQSHALILARRFLHAGAQTP